MRIRVRAFVRAHAHVHSLLHVECLEMLVNACVGVGAANLCANLRVNVCARMLLTLRF